MSNRSSQHASLRVVLLLALVSPASAGGSGHGPEFSADVRLRLEGDFDSRQADGAPQDDRGRLRIRARLGLTHRAGEHVQFGLRIRSGSDLSHQSPHVTLIDFNGDDTGDADFNLDRWFVRGENDRVWGWAGRESLPFWKQNELFWDDDVTAAGVAGGVRGSLRGDTSFAVNTAFVTPPVGMHDFAGRLTGAQAVFARSGSDLDFTMAGAFYAYDAADPADDPDAATLANGNGLRDYRIASVSGQVTLGPGDRPFLLGVDSWHNTHGHAAADPDPYTAAHRGRKDGYALSVRFGSAESAGDWALAYTFARIGALAIHGSYGQDDGFRWAETTAADFEGHELRFDYGAWPKALLTARLFLVETLTSLQEGNRVRVDLNYRY